MDNNNYFKTNRFLKYLRFFNLLEPDRNILSISKIFMWVMLFIMIYVLAYHPENLEAVIGAVGTTLLTTLNYSFRRWVQTTNIEMGRKDSVTSDGSITPEATVTLPEVTSQVTTEEGNIDG